MKTTADKTTTASARQKVAPNERLVTGFDGRLQIAIPAEKPTAQEIARMENAWALDEWNMARESAKYKAHADKLAEALRDMLMQHANNGQHRANAIEALEAYKASKQ